MKKIIYGLAHVFLMMHVFAQAPIPHITSTSGNTNLTSTGITNIRGTKLVVGPTSYKVSSYAMLDVAASEEISIQSEFQATGFFPGAGNSRFYIDDTQMAVASFHPGGFSNIPQYSRFEMGIRLPAATQAQINTFLATYSGPAQGLNPYDPDQVRIECLFYAQDGSPAVKRNGFYYQPYSVNNNSYIEETTDYQFRVRFAPPKTGTYRCDIRVYMNNSGTPSLTYNNIYFNVVGTNNPGFLAVDATTKKLRFTDQGQPYFFGIGQNMEVLGDADDDISLHPNFPYDNHYEFDANGNACCWSVNYGPNEAKASARTNNFQRTCINDLAQNKGNFIRLRLNPDIYPFDVPDVRKGPNSEDITRYDLNRTLNNYQHNQMFLGELDKTLDLCESEGVYIMLNLFADQLTVRFDESPYHTIINNNSSIENTIYGFFTEPAAKEVFKNQLYYVHARWGYSPNIALWQMINETENIYSYRAREINGVTTPYNPNLKSVVQAWVCDMKSYLDGFYPRHLVTNGTISSASINDVNCLDVYSSNDYNNDVDGSSWKDQIHVFASSYNNVGKPFLFGEVGLGVECRKGFNGIERWLDGELYNDRSFHNNIWASMAGSSIATGLNWWDRDQKFNVQHRLNFKAMRKFTNEIEWWRNLKSQRYANSWYGNKITGTTPSGEEHSIFNLFMTNNGGPNNPATYAVGWSVLYPSYWAVDNSINPYTGLPQFPNYNDYADCIGLNLQDVKDYDITNNVYEPPIVITGMVANKIFRLEMFDAHYETVNPTSWPVLSGPTGDISFHINFKNHEFPDRAYIIHDDAQEYFSNHSVVVNDPLVKQYDEDFKPGANNQNRTASTNIENELSPAGLIRREIEMNRLSVFPNPSNDIINVSYNEAYFSNVEICVYDLTGKLITKTTNAKRVSVDDLDQGLYMIVFKSDQAEKSFKISINH